MRKIFGVCCIILGICCLIASVGLIAYNHWEEENAQNSSEVILQDIQACILDNTHDDSSTEEVKQEKQAEQEEVIEIPVDIPQEMLTTQVNGYDCIGVLTIPVLELELPVLTDWSYTKLKVAPCRYSGSYFEKDFVIAAHNFQSHFGRLTALQTKDLILFTDISGTVHSYEVVLLETLPATAIEEMISSGFDLSLYTCTPGGASRLTVRCSAVVGHWMKSDAGN